VFVSLGSNLGDREGYLRAAREALSALPGTSIEREHGRTRELRFGPRTLDIDILLFQDAESDDPELTLPHPRMVKRAFVLVPLAEIWEHAVGMTDIDVAGLGEATSRIQRVRLYDATEG
jgi:2-amino-4-hydroxy-6-hydroxymethyldihydropteridine diphosphokinase